MKKLHQFILKSFIGPFIVTFCIATFILLMQFMWKYIEDFVGKGLDFFIFSKLIFYICMSLIPMALPLAVLLASLMTFGNLGENYELTALKSAGISLQRIMSPLVLLTILISTAAFYFSNNILPYSNLKMKSLIYDIQRQKPDFQIKEGAFYSGIDGYIIRIDKKKQSNNMLYNVKIYDHTDERGNVKVTTADSGFMNMTPDEQNLIVTLFDGYNYEELEEEQRRLDKRTFPHRRDKFRKQQITFDLSGFGLHRTDEQLFKSGYKMMNLQQLNEYVDSNATVIHKKADDFYDNLIVANYFKNIYFNDTNNVLTTDTINETAPLPVHKMDFFSGLRYNQKQRVIRGAINNARRTTDYTSLIFRQLEWKWKQHIKYDIERHRKFTLSFACFIFFFIGAPLGAIIRKGGFGMPIVVSVLFFILYYIITLLGEKFVKELYILPTYGMWVPSLILLPVGIFLTYKATTDASIMSFEAYSNFFKKLFPAKEKFKSFENKFIIPADDKEIKKQNILISLESLIKESDEQLNELRTDLFYLVSQLFQGRFDILHVLFFRNHTKFREYINFYRTLYGQVFLTYRDNQILLNKLGELPVLFDKKYRQDFVSPLILIILLIIFLPVGIIVFAVKLTQLNILKGKIFKVKYLTQEIYNNLVFHFDS